MRRKKEEETIGRELQTQTQERKLTAKNTFIPNTHPLCVQILDPRTETAKVFFFFFLDQTPYRVESIPTSTLKGVLKTNGSVDR